MKLSTSSLARQNGLFQEISTEVLPLSMASDAITTTMPDNRQGMVSELLYQNPLMINHILLPVKTV